MSVSFEISPEIKNLQSDPQFFALPFHSLLLRFLDSDLPASHFQTVNKASLEKTATMLNDLENQYLDSLKWTSAAKKHKGLQ